MPPEPVRLPVRLIPINQHVDDQTLFAMLYPDYRAWLDHRAIAFMVSCYRWPEMMAHIAGAPIGLTVCELELTVAPDYHAEVLAMLGIDETP